MMMPQQGLGGMAPDQLTAMLSDPQTPPGLRAAAMAAMQMHQPSAPQQPPAQTPQAAPGPQQPAQLPPFNAAPPDVMAPLRAGTALADSMRMAMGGAVRAYARGGMVRNTPIHMNGLEAGGGDVSAAAAMQPDGFEDDSDMTGDPTVSRGTDSTGLAGVSPKFLNLIKKFMPTSEDKGLALASAGFGMAASKSPHFGQALGEGASAGVDALQKIRQERAVQAMKVAQLQDLGEYRTDSLKEKAASRAVQDKRAQIEDTRWQEQLTETKRNHDLQDAEAKARAEDAAGNKADRLEQRYNTAANNRLNTYSRTGVWQKIEGDEEHGITGAPDMGGYQGPLIGSPNISLKDKQKLEVAKPQTMKATTLVVDNLGDMAKTAEDMLKHPGLSKATSFGGTLVSKIPGTEAADFLAKINTLKSKTFVNNLSAMRESSKTGGAVGNVSDKEGDRMAALQASLEQAQTGKQYKEALQAIVDYAHRTGGTMKKAYVETYGDKDAPELPWENKAAAGSNKVHVQKGPEILEIDPADLEHATADGYEVVK